MIDPPFAILLVAGSGTRLRPLTDEIPKALVEVGKETILERAVRLLCDVGVRHFVFATGYKAKKVQDFVSPRPVSASYRNNDAYETTQNSVSLQIALRDVPRGPFFKLDGDLLFHPSVLRRLLDGTGSARVAVDTGAVLAHEEMKVKAVGATISAFGKGLDPAACAGESIGVEFFEEAALTPLRRALDRSCAKRSDLYYEDVYNDLIAEGMSFGLTDVADLGWCEVDTLEDLTNARELVLSGALG